MKEYIKYVDTDSKPSFAEGSYIPYKLQFMHCILCWSDN